ncbi:hypothetical protein CQW39_09550 [Streptomyces griseofuscus]|uniref:hypothetical protein n=1 Tax=Streptomyces griseofuscus TaxID=146922 RepID=UPI000F64C206|nr:hypothetical protein [Streptomyces griseofuscus]RRQ79380.1 hypothetical protein CQW39_09550 [Streptomyces griseofuscus]
MNDEFDPDEDDAEQLAALSDDDLAAALDSLYGHDPLAGYATPATRRRKPDAVGRAVEDVRRTL